MRILLLFCNLLIFSFVVRAQPDDYFVEEFKEHKDKIISLEFSKSGKFLASGGEDKLLVIRNMSDESLSVEFPDNYFPVRDMEFFGDQQLFVASGSDIKLVDLENQKLALYQGNATHIWSLDFAPERNKLTAGSYDKVLRVWDVKSEEVEFKLEGHEKSALVCVFSIDEQYLVSGSRDQTIKIWNAKTGELMHSTERHSDNIYDIKFHPNTKYFASSSGDKTIRLWNVEDATVVKTYAGHDKAIVDIEFSPDGYYMYSAGIDGVVYIWEVATGKKLYSYVDHEGAVNSVAVSNDGFWVATGGDDGKVMLWKSAMVIAVDEKFADDIMREKSGNPVFDDRRKGESKQEYHEREKEAQKAEIAIYKNYFEKYIQKTNLRNTP